MARYEIYVTYKKGIFDPPGATAKRALVNLGYEGVHDVKIGKYIQLDSDAQLETVREMCDRLLANPVIEDYRIESAEGVSEMRFGVVIFPGSNCEQDVIHAARYLGFEAEYVWHGDTDLSGFDAIVLPGGFSYGDYIRCGAVARFSPVMSEVMRFADRGGPVLGICNGFQILCEAHMLPGALLRNRGLKFICKPVHVRAESRLSEWFDVEPGSVLTIPINHNEGNFICDAETLDTLNAKGQVVLRYCEEDGSRAPGGSAPNGALDDIAGVCNERGNVFGLMPHPERVVDPLTGGTDGQQVFASIARRLQAVAG